MGGWGAIFFGFFFLVMGVFFCLFVSGDGGLVVLDQAGREDGDEATRQK